jgi:hypothetical protein
VAVRLAAAAVGNRVATDQTSHSIQLIVISAANRAQEKNDNVSNWECLQTKLNSECLIEFEAEI